MAWQSATSGSQPLANHVNQFLVTHPSQHLYAATVQSSQTTAGATSTATNSLFLAQRFTTGGGQTTVGYISIPLTTTVTSGSSLVTTTVSLRADNAGVPATSNLVSTTVTAEYANLASGGTATTSLLYPLPATGLSTTTQYWIVVASAGSPGSAYTWFRSNQVSGAFTSPTGSTWTGQAYGFLYRVFDQSVSGLLTCTWEDSGARWTARTYTASTNLLATYAEYTSGQTSSGYLQSFRTNTYSGSYLTKVV